jgi:hypothetical protein
MGITMKCKVKCFHLICAVILTAQLCFAQTVKRGRNEGTFYIPASNVMGNGNITAYTDVSGIVTLEKAEANASIGASIGIAEILQFSAQTSFINFQRFGPTEIHLHATLPGNDKVRFFGVGVIADLYLSTSIDTLDKDADSNKPYYKAYPLASLIVDLDWLSLSHHLPFKTYLAASLSDNPELLHEYKQLAFKAGIELKMYKHSVFVDVGHGMYKERYAKLEPKAWLDKMYSWVSPGMRYRIRNRYSILANVRWTFFRSINTTGSLDPKKISAAVKFEAPILFRETNTEAIRTLVFIKKAKKEEKHEQEKLTKDIKFEIDLLGKLDNSILGLKDKDETFNYDKEKENLIQRREEIKRNMEDIEKLLKEDKE